MRVRVVVRTSPLHLLTLLEYALVPAEDQPLTKRASARGLGLGFVPGLGLGLARTRRRPAADEARAGTRPEERLPRCQHLLDDRQDAAMGVLRRTSRPRAR